MSINVIKYEWDISGDIEGEANSIKNLNFRIWLGTGVNIEEIRYVDIDLFEIWDKEETKVIASELDLKQLVCLRDFLNSLPFLDKELGEKK